MVIDELTDLLTWPRPEIQNHQWPEKKKRVMGLAGEWIHALRLFQNPTPQNGKGAAKGGHKAVSCSRRHSMCRGRRVRWSGIQSIWEDEHVNLRHYLVFSQKNKNKKKRDGETHVSTLSK